MGCEMSLDTSNLIVCYVENFPHLIPTVITACIATIGSILAFFSLRANYLLSRSKNAIDFEKALEDSDGYKASLDELSSFKSTTMSEPLALIDLAKNPKSDPKAYESALYILNWWERGANGIKCKVYREDVLLKVYRGHLINLTEYLKPFIKERRQHNPRVFKEIEWLTKRWEAHTRNEDRNHRRKKFMFVIFLCFWL